MYIQSLEKKKSLWRTRVIVLIPAEDFFLWWWGLYTVCILGDSAMGLVPLITIKSIVMEILRLFTKNAVFHHSTDQHSGGAKNLRMSN
jgi:hypothetical protein